MSTTVTTQFKYNRVLDDFTIFNQPLYLLGSFIQNKLLNTLNTLKSHDLTSDKNTYFEKLSICEKNTTNFYLEIDTYKKTENISDISDISDEVETSNSIETSDVSNASNASNSNNMSIPETLIKITYLLDRLKFSEEFTFLYDGVKFVFKTDKVFDKNALSINRDCFAIFSTYTITCNKDDFVKFESFISDSINYYNIFYTENIIGNDKIKLYLSSDEGGYFINLGSRPKRSLDTIYLPSKHKKAMIDDLTYFLHPNTCKKYKTLGITHKRTYLFEGVPGAGKSSFIMALASHFEYNIAIISFTPKMTDNDLIRLMRSLEEKESGGKIFIIFEDMDCIFKARKSNDDSKNQVTFSGILNALDGITTRDNMICFITTNYKHNLDPALIRPGRVDYIMRFDYIIKEQILDIFTKFTGHSNKALKFYDELYRFNINISTSLLQQYLLKYINEPNVDKIIDNIDELKKMYDAAHITTEAGETGLYS